MSVKLQWRCDTCGRREIRAGFDIPAGWRVTSGRTITHSCDECKPPDTNPGLARKLWSWCARNRALSLMVFNFVSLLIFVCVGTVLCASQFRQLNARIAELEATRDGLLDAIDKLARR